MQKSLRWYKNWKCSIKRIHLNVWLVKVNVVLKFFICHTPWGLSCLPCLWKLPTALSGVKENMTNRASAGVLWICANLSRPWPPFSLLQTSHSKNLSPVCCVLQLLWKEHDQGPMSWWLPNKHQRTPSAHSTQPDSHWDAPERMPQCCLSAIKS